jgi:hypothetical protein
MAFGSNSLTTLITNSNSKFECERVAPLFLIECAEWAGWLAHGWLGSDAPASVRKQLLKLKLLHFSMPCYNKL